MFIGGDGLYARLMYRQPEIKRAIADGPLPIPLGSEKNESSFGTRAAEEKTKKP